MKTSWRNRRDVALAAAWFALLVGASAPAAAAAAQGADGRPAAANYGFATDHLRRGRWFERAAAQLREAVRQEPENADHRLALGCALASRAASLSYAATFAHTLAGEQAGYPELLTQWQAAQKDPNSEGHGDPRPEPPPDFVFRTKDDDRPFRLSKAEAEARIAQLDREARAEWERAAVLARTDGERARVAYVRGWGLWLLQRYAGQPPEETTPLPFARNPSAPKEALEAFRAAVRLAPEVAAYWRSLGDALADTNRAEAITVYRRSLALEKRNPTLWYRLYRWSTEKSPAPSEDAGIEDLRRAAESDPANAFPLYELSSWKFKETGYGGILGGPAEERDAKIARLARTADDPERKAAREAIGWIERGNRAPRYDPLFYRPAVPVLLAAAWRYRERIEMIGDIGTLGFARLRELSRAASGFGLVAAQRRQVAEAERSSRAVIGMGHRLVGDSPVRDDWERNKTVIQGLVGTAIAAVGYRNLEAVYRRTGDTARAERALAEYNAFRARSDAYRKAVQENLPVGNATSLIQLY